MSATATKPLRDRLREVESNIDGLRDAEKTAADEQKAAQAAYAGLENLKPGSPEFEEAKAATAKVGEIRDDINAWKAEQVDILRMLGQEAGDTPNSNGNGDKPRPNGDNRQFAGWDSGALLADEGIQAQLTRAATSKAGVGVIQIGQVVDRDTFAADIAPTSNMRRGDYFGVVPQIQRPLTILDILPTGTMNGNLLPYTQESGSFGAVEVTEGSLKTEDGVTYTDASAVAQTIAAWMKIRKQALEDVPALQAIIDNRLRYSVRRRLEGQVLNGNGTDPNIRGILQTSGIGSVAADAAQLAADQILVGLTSVLLADGQADGIAAHPTDWMKILKAKAAGDGHYYSGGPFSVTPQTLWGVPLIPSPAVPVTHSLVGDFAIGAQLFIRTGVTVLMSDSDQDDFLRNRMTLLGEMRAALAVWRPALFVDVNV